VAIKIEPQANFPILDPNTNTLYLIAGALSICLSLVLWALARLQPDSGLMRRSVVAILLLSAGLLVSGYGPVLPRWMIVVCANLILLSAAAVICSGFADYCELHPGKPERFGWAVVALTVLPFWYWGLIDSVGNYRSAIFSFALAAILARITFTLTRKGWPYARSPLSLVTAMVLGLIAAGMAARGVLALVIQAPPGKRAVNPTEWPTVAAYMLLMSALALCVMWIGLGQSQPERRDTLHRAQAAFSFVEYFRNKLSLLLAMVLVLVLAAAGESALFYTKSFQWEKERLTQAAQLRNDVLVEHSLQVMTQVDTLLHAVRSFYLRSHSATETEAFINSLPFDKSVIENVYLISGQGKIVITHDPLQSSVDAADRYYFLHHQATAPDQILIGPVDIGRVTHQLYFRVTRRISYADGSFAGVVLATVKPQAFSRYYQEAVGGSQNSIALLGTLDKKLRARVPEPAPELWTTPVESALWAALQQAPQGSYEATSAIDNTRRIFTYQSVGTLPLVLVNGFSDSTISASMHERIRWPTIGLFITLVIVLTLAAFLTGEIRRRNEQDQFMAMLSHELKSPLAVISLSLGTQSIPMEVKLRVSRATNAMNVILERCLQADQIDHRQVSVAVPCQVEEVLLDVVSRCAFPQRVELAAADLPLCKTDVQLLDVALGNLIGNAFKHGAPESTVSVRVLASTRWLRKGISITVANAPGPSGFPDPLKIFRKYYRSAGAHSKSGSGLGLHIAQGCARHLGGGLRYRPTVDCVRFELWLPL
jgi:signal transduction histidine kinase